MKKNIAVILSTYNGERFLTEQLASLAAQKDVSLTLYVRDDGSSDSTRDLLENFQAPTIQKVLFFEENVGFERSFMEATLKVDLEAHDYFAFCDQDDIWDAQKLSLAIQVIEQSHSDSPFLYASNQRIVDENGEWIRDEADKNQLITKESSLLALNQRGCVMVWNRPLQKHLQKSYQRVQDEAFIPAHDTWITVLAYATGQVYLDSSITMSYRVSTHNTAGSYIGLVGRGRYIWKKIKDVLTKRQFQKTKVATLLEAYLEQEGLDRHHVQTFLEAGQSWSAKAQLLFGKPDYFRGMSYKWQLLSRVLILVGRI